MGTIEEVDDDDFTLTRSFDKFETASEMNEMYDILLSDMSEKEQMEALDKPYKKKKPKARMNKKSPTDVTKNTSAEVSVSDEKEKEEEEGQEEGQGEEESTVVTYRFSAHAHPVQS